MSAFQLIEFFYKSLNSVVVETMSFHALLKGFKRAYVTAYAMQAVFSKKRSALRILADKIAKSNVFVDFQHKLYPFIVYYNFTRIRMLIGKAQYEI